MKKIQAGGRDVIDLTYCELLDAFREQDFENGWCYVAGYLLHGELDRASGDITKYRLVTLMW